MLVVTILGLMQTSPPVWKVLQGSAVQKREEKGAEWRGGEGGHDRQSSTLPWPWKAPCR